MGSPLWMVVPQENDESNHAKPVGILTLHVWIPLLLLPLFCSKHQAVGNCSASGCEDASMLQIHASDDSMLQTAASATCTWKLSALGAWRHVVVWSFSSVKDSRFFSQMIKKCLSLPSKLGTCRRNFLLFSRKQLCSGLQTGKVRSRPAESPFRLEQKVIFHRLTWIQEGSLGFQEWLSICYCRVKPRSFFLWFFDWNSVRSSAQECGHKPWEDLQWQSNKQWEEGSSTYLP